MSRPFKIPFITLERDWEGETVVIMGNGTSMLETDLTVVKESGARTMVMNGGYSFYDRADVLMCSDRWWLNKQTNFRGYRGPLIITTRPQYARVRDKRMVAVKRYPVFWKNAAERMRDPSTVVEGYTSVSSCISVAVHRGVSRIILLGVDLRPGKERKRRATDDTADEPVLARQRYAKQALHLGMQAEIIRGMGIEVVNCSPPSILSAYPLADIREVLKC